MKRQQQIEILKSLIEEIESLDPDDAGMPAEFRRITLDGERLEAVYHAIASYYDVFEDVEDDEPDNSDPEHEAQIAQGQADDAAAQKQAERMGIEWE